MPQRSVASNYTFEQQRTEINLLAADFWTQKTNVDNASSTYLKHNGSNDFTGSTLNVPNAFTISPDSGNGTLTISGNLNVTGTTTTVNTTNLDVTDKNITIAKGNNADSSADGAGLTIDSATDITWNFVDANDAWVSSIGVEATNFLKGPYGHFTGSGSYTPTTGQGVEINVPDANTGQIISYDRDNTAYKDLRIKGSSVGFYTGTTNALSGTFNSTGLLMEAGKTIELDDTIVHSGDPDTKIRFPAGDTVQFETAGSNRLSIDTNALFVQAGFPLAFLATGGGATPHIKSGGTNNQDLLFTTGAGNPNRLYITAAGKILGGNHINDRGAVLQIESSDHAMIGLHRNTDDHGSPALHFSASRGTSAGAVDLVLDEDYLGLIRFSGADGVDLATGAYITAIVDGTAASNVMPTRLGLWTSLTNESPVERLRITSGGATEVYGDLYVKNTYPRIYLLDTNSNSDFSLINDNGTFSIYDDSNSAHRLSITSDGDITTPAGGRLFVGGDGNPTNLAGVQYSKLLVDVANNADYIHFRKNVGQNQPILNITHNQDYLAAARYANSGDAWVTGVETSGNFIFSHGMGAAGGGGSTTLTLDSSGSLVSKSSMFNHYNHLVCQGGSGGDAHRNYILVCKTTTIDARLAGEFVITRQAGASGIAISRIEANLCGNPSAADFRYQTRSISTNGSYPGMYGQWVTLEFGGTTYYAIRLDPVAGSSRWASQPQHCYFKGTENNCVGNGLGTIIDSNANTITNITDLNDIQGHIITKNSTVDLSGRLSVDPSGRVIVGGGTHTGGAALVVKGDGNTPNSYAAAAFCKMGANPTSNTTLANLRFSGGAAGTNRAAEINVKTDSNWNDGTSQESKMEFTLAESGGGNTAGNPVMTLKGTGNVEVNRGELHIASKLVHDGDTDTNINFGTNTITINAGNRTAINCNSNMTEISSPVQYNNAREYTTSSNSTWQTICTFSTSTAGFSMECGVRENNYTTMHRVSGSANWNQCYFTADFAGDSNHGHSSDIEFRVIDNDKLQFKAISHTTTRVLSVISIWVASGYVTWA